MSAIAKTVAMWIFEFLFGKFMAWYRGRQETKKSDEKIDQEATQKAEGMKDAKTQDELDRADRDLLG